MCTEKKSVSVVTVTRLKDSACNSILNLHPSLTIIDAMVFLSFTSVAPKL